MVDQRDKIEAVATAVWEAQRQYLAITYADAKVAAWEDQSREFRQIWRGHVGVALDSPNAREFLPDFIMGTDPRRYDLFIGTLRHMAAALGMSVTYENGVVRDWSKPQPAPCKACLLEGMETPPMHTCQVP